MGTSAETAVKRVIAARLENGSGVDMIRPYAVN
jgi:hypothetical protein